MAASPVPAAQQRLFHLAVSVDREILQHQPTLAGAIRDRLMAQVEPACTVEVEPGDFVGFTVEASSFEDVEELGIRGGARLASGLQWVEDQATEILDRIFYPSSQEVHKPLRATLALALAISGRMALVALLAVALPALAEAAEPDPTTFRVMLYGSTEPSLEPPAFLGQDPVEVVVHLDASEVCQRSLLESALLYVPGSWGDAITTEYFLAQGGHERNPLMRERWVRIPFKLIAEPLLSAAADRWLERKFGKSTARGFRAGMWLIRGGLMFLNIRYGNSLRGPVRSISERSGR
jgi:hypothetical protein